GQSTRHEYVELIEADKSALLPRVINPRVNPADLRTHGRERTAEPNAGPEQHQKDLIARGAEVERRGEEFALHGIKARDRFDALRVIGPHADHVSCRGALPVRVGGEEAGLDTDDVDRAG